MEKLWFFAETGQVFMVPDAESIIDDKGAPLAEAIKYEREFGSLKSFARLCETAAQIILVTGQKEIDPGYLAHIPTNLPRIALINSDTATPVRPQLDQLSPDAFLFSPFVRDSVNAAIQKCYEDKKSLLTLEEELKNYSEIAFTAMSSASEMGVVAFYAQAVHNVASLERLAQQTLQCLSDLSVQGFIQFSFDDVTQVFPQDVSTAYRKLLDITRKSAHRIVSHGRFLLFNFENAQLVIIDAPTENPDKYGRLRDVIAHIASIAEARAKTIKVNDLLKIQQEKTRTVMTLLEMASRDNRTSVRTIMTELSMALRELAMGMDLTLDQETSILQLSEQALNSLESLHAATDAVEGYFRSLLLELDQAAKLLETAESFGAPAADAKVELF